MWCWALWLPVVLVPGSLFMNLLFRNGDRRLGKTAAEVEGEEVGEEEEEDGDEEDEVDWEQKEEEEE